MAISKVYAIAAINPNAFCTSKIVDGVEVVTWEPGITPISDSDIAAKLSLIHI